MARESRPKSSARSGLLKEETRYGILALLCFAIALFFLLASFNYAGVAGGLVYRWLSRLFGAGFFIIPAIVFLLGLSFLRPTRPYLVLSHLLGGALIFLASLGIVGILFPGTENKVSGGLIGRLIAAPLLNIFDLYSLIFLGTMTLIGILIMFEAELHLPKFRLGRLLAWIFKRQQEVVVLNQQGEEAPVYERGSETAAKMEEQLTGAEKKARERPEEGERPGKTVWPRIPVWGLKKESGLFTPPPLSLLAQDSGRPAAGDIKANANIIKRTLANFGINVEMDEISIGPSITRYALKPAEGVKLSRIVALHNDLALALAAHPIRIEAPIPGRSLVGIEIPNSIKSIVGLAPLLGHPEFVESPHPLLVALGRSISGAAHFANLSKAPHILIAGATGSGKSVVIHTFVVSLLYRNPPDRLRLILIDPKRVELVLHNGIPHLLTPVVTDPKKAILVLKWATKEMERRYHILSAYEVRDIASYHKNILGREEEMLDKMPYIVIVLDELADIMATYPRELEAAIIRLAQMSRAVGIHLILSTQRPSVEIITGLIKANIPTRIALQVISQVDSRTILDMAGAEKLLGAGDMLYLAAEMTKPIRLQGAFISEEEVKKVVEFLVKKYQGEVFASLDEQITVTDTESEWPPRLDLNLQTMAGEEDDVLYEAARDLVIKAGKASASYLQRKFKIGYARAARLLDMLEERGVVGPAEGAKHRVVYEKYPPAETEL